MYKKQFTNLLMIVATILMASCSGINSNFHDHDPDLEEFLSKESREVIEGLVALMEAGEILRDEDEYVKKAVEAVLEKTKKKDLGKAVKNYDSKKIAACDEQSLEKELISVAEPFDMSAEEKASFIKFIISKCKEDYVNYAQEVVRIGEEYGINELKNKKIGFFASFTEARFTDDEYKLIATWLVKVDLAKSRFKLACYKSMLK